MLKLIWDNIAINTDMIDHLELDNETPTVFIYWEWGLVSMTFPDSKVSDLLLMRLVIEYLNDANSALVGKGRQWSWVETLKNFTATLH